MLGDLEDRGGGVRLLGLGEELRVEPVDPVLGVLVSKDGRDALVFSRFVVVLEEEVGSTDEVFPDEELVPIPVPFSVLGFVRPAPEVTPDRPELAHEHRGRDVDGGERRAVVRPPVNP